MGKPGRPRKTTLSPFGERLRRLIDARFETRNSFLEDPGGGQWLSPNTLHLYEIGKRSPDSETLAKMADLLKTTTDYLLGRSTDPRPYPEIQEEVATLHARVAEQQARYGERVERDEDEPPESLLVWERTLAPRAYVPKIHRAALMATLHRYPPSEAWRWTGVFQRVTDSGGPSESDAAEMAAARAEADRLGAKKPPKKVPRRR